MDLGVVVGELVLLVLGVEYLLLLALNEGAVLGILDILLRVPQHQRPRQLLVCPESPLVSPITCMSMRTHNIL